MLSKSIIRVIYLVLLLCFLSGLIFTESGPSTFLSSSSIPELSNVSFLTSRTNWKPVYATELGQFLQLNVSSNGSVNLIDNIREVFVSDDIAYISDDTYGLLLINVTDPTHPTFLNAYNSSTRHIHVFNDLAYLSSSEGLTILNVTIPTDLSLVGNYSGIDADGLYFSDNIVYLGHRYHGLKLINVTDPTSPDLLGELVYGSNQDYHTVVVSDHIAYVGDFQGQNLKIINVSDPTQPQLLDILSGLGTGFGHSDGGPLDIFLSGHLVYIADYTAGFKIVNITDPTSVTLLKSYSTSGRASGVFISGSIAFFTDHDYGLEFYNVSNPLAITFVGSAYPHAGEAYSVFVFDSLAFVGYGADGLKIFDIYDTDGDDLSDWLEFNVYFTNVTNCDTDHDLVLDGDEVKKYSTNPHLNDTDFDYLLDGEELFWYHTNPFSVDSDNDTIGDYDELMVYFIDPMDNDTDNDNLLDPEELFECGTNPGDPDTDSEYWNDLNKNQFYDGPHEWDPSYDENGDGVWNGDSLRDGDEVFNYGTDPTAPDSDSDGLHDGEEVILYGTDPNNVDSDNDGLPDGYEVEHGLNPLIPTVITSTPSVTTSLTSTAVSTSSSPSFPVISPSFSFLNLVFVIPLMWVTYHKRRK